MGRHYGHRKHCQTVVGGQHFHKAHDGNMDNLEITIIESVQHGNHLLLNQKEDLWICRLMSMEYINQGGMNIRDNLKRNTRLTCRCKFCTRLKEKTKKTKPPGGREGSPNVCSPQFLFFCDLNPMQNIRTLQ